MLGSDLLGAQPGRQADRAPRQVMERGARQRPAVLWLLAGRWVLRSHHRPQRLKKPRMGDAELAEHLAGDRRLLAERQQQVLTTEPVVAQLASLLARPPAHPLHRSSSLAGRGDTIMYPSARPGKKPIVGLVASLDST